MKKRKRMRRVFLVLGLMIFCAPYLIGLGFFTEKIEKTIRQKGEIEPHIGRLAWNWFPLPHVSLRNTRLIHDVGQITIGSIDVYPDMWDLITGHLQIRSVGIVSPKIKLRSLDALHDVMRATPEKEDTQKKSLLFEPITLDVEDGRVELPWNGSLAALEGKVPALALSDIRMNLASTPAHMTISGSFRTPYSDECVTELTLENAPDRDWGWDLAIRAKAVNLDPIRAILIRMFEGNERINLVCGDIIRSGHVREGQFSFKGKTSQWQDLDRMIVTANAEQASVHIPGTGLFLERTSGLIRIEKSLLSGDRLTVSLGTSFGKNGSFLLGLGHGDERFGLDVDLDADLSKLPAILDEFVPRADVKQELGRIRDLQGKADAHLNLGETLGDIKAHVSVSSLNASCFYQRINEPVIIRGGSLDFNPTSISWKDLTGAMGPSAIQGTSGSISWEKDVRLNVSRLDAGLDTGDLYHELTQDKDLAHRIQSVLTGIAGTVVLREFSLTGALSRPESFSFKGIAASTSLVVESPHVPERLELISPGVHFSHDSLRTDVLTARMGNQTLRIAGHVEHLLSKKNMGEIVLQGIVSPSSAEWLRKQGWIPEALFPRLPCTLSPLSLMWAKDMITISGTIQHLDAQGQMITTQADVAVHNGETKIRQLSITTQEDKAEFTATLPTSQGQDDAEFSFQGKLKDRTLDGMLEKTGRPAGNISGMFSFVYPLKNPGYIRLDGQAELNNLKLDVSGLGVLGLEKGQITGKTDSAEFDLNNLSFTRSPSDKDSGLEKITFPQIAGTLSFFPDKQSRITIRSGNACGIHVAGRVDLPAQDMDLHFNTEKGKTLRFQDVFACLGVSQTRISGDLTFEGSIQGTPNMIDQGAFTLNAENGVVFQAPLLPRIFALLDLTELFSANQVKNLMADGYRYDSIEITGTITGHNIHITRAKIIGAGINFYATGYIDLGNQSLDLLVLASPFKAVDSLVNHIPLIGKVLGGKNKSILSVPVKVEGHLNDPRTRILPKSISVMSTGILDAFVYTFKLPFELSYELVNGKTKSPATPARNP